MSRGEPMSDSAPFFSSDSEAEGPEDQGTATANQQPDEESPSGVSRGRALVIVFVLCYINLLNYMDRFTVAGMLLPGTFVHIHVSDACEDSRVGPMHAWKLFL